MNSPKKNGKWSVLLTCPPMIGQSHRYRDLYDRHRLEVVIPDFCQTMTEDDLCGLVPLYDGWIIGDDPATRRVLEAGKAGRLRCAGRR